MAFLHHHHHHLLLLLLVLFSSPRFCSYVGTLQISREAELKGRGRLVYDDESGLNLHQTERNTSMDRSVKERDGSNKNSTTTQMSVSKGEDLQNQKEKERNNGDAHKSSTKKATFLGNKTMADVNKTGSLGSPPPPPSEKRNQTDKGSLQNSTDVASLDPDSDENEPDPEENVAEAKEKGNSTKADEKEKVPEAKEDGLDIDDDNSSDAKENDLDSENAGPEEKENSLDSDDNDPDKKENVPESKGNDSKSKEKDQNSDSPAISCGESHCEIPDMPITACLHTPGHGIHMLALSITYEGDSIKSKDGEITVKVSAPDLLLPDLSEVTIKEPSSKTIEFRMNPKLEGSEVNIKDLEPMTIRVSSPKDGECNIWLPIDYLQNIAQKKDFQHFLPSSAYAAFATNPMVSATLVFFVVALTSIVGWLCHKFCGRKRNVDTVRYQQLEMIESETPKDNINETSDGWDESWDDDWEDAEAVKSSSRMSQSLSSRGLAARRGNKDAWDNDWDD